MRAATSSALAALAVYAGTALADTHYLFSGLMTGTTLVGLEFDDVASTLTLVNNITTETSNGAIWIALDSRLKNLYLATPDFGFQSYAITDDLGLTWQSNISLPSACADPNHIAVTTAPPYTVFGVELVTGCPGYAMSVDDEVALQSILANVTHDSAAAVHGAALSPDNAFVYSADDSGNAVWVHSYDGAAGTVQEVQKLDAEDGMDPRHLTVHSNGLWVYVVYEAGNAIAVYSRDRGTGELTFTDTTYSLLPSGYNTSSYWADEAILSIPPAASGSPKYLLASTRSRVANATGYVSAFALDADTGAVSEQLFLRPTTGTGGASNAVGPARFSEEYFTITDNDANFAEVWRIDGCLASAVAHLDLEPGPWNPVWYS